ncbi:MAG: flippase-like domain-containing protein [Gemmatimonadetes bacterium]|nr:flippase-like domain-containing protein [Gemmatimonadota bacterium]
MASLLTPRILKRGLQVFGLISVIGVGVLLVYTGAWQSTLDAFTRVKPLWLLVALLLASSDWIGGGIRIWLLTRHVHQPTPFWGMVVAGGLTAWAAYLTPSQAGGGPTMIYTMRRYGVPIPEAMTSTLMSFLTTVIFFAIAGPLAIVFGAGRSLEAHGIGLLNISLYDVFRTSAATFGLIGGVMILALGFPRVTAQLFHAVVGWLGRHRGERMAQRVDGLRAGIDRTHDCVVAYFRTPSGWLQMLLGVLTSGLAHANRLVAGYVVLRALGIQAHFVDVLILQTTISFLLYFAPTPGGAGAAEALSAALMSVYVPRALIPAYTIIWRFMVSYATVILGSFVFYKLLHGRLDEAEESAAAPQIA